MPTDEEKKEQDAADNDISDEITDSEKADNAELTDVSENTQDKADNVTDDNKIRFLILKIRILWIQKHLRKHMKKIIARKNTVQKLRKSAESLRKILRWLTCMLT